jgi:ribulose-5-phosphate 4-epimerase/fuculose-1-phosphate aldolase
MKPAVLMRGHGAAVVGMSLSQVVERSIYLSINATVQLQAMTLGGSPKYLDAEEAAKALGAGDNTGYPRDWDLWKSKIAGSR